MVRRRHLKGCHEIMSFDEPNALELPKVKPSSDAALGHSARRLFAYYDSRTSLVLSCSHGSGGTFPNTPRGIWPGSIPAVQPCLLCVLTIKSHIARNISMIVRQI